VPLHPDGGVPGRALELRETVEEPMGRDDAVLLHGPGQHGGAELHQLLRQGQRRPRAGQEGIHGLQEVLRLAVLRPVQGPFPEGPLHAGPACRPGTPKAGKGLPQRLEARQGRRGSLGEDPRIVAEGRRAEQREQRRRPAEALPRVEDELGGRLVEVATPEIADDLLPQQALVGQQLRVEGAAALEGVLGEHPPAEGVDRKDRGLVEPTQGLAQPVPGILRVGKPAGEIREEGLVRPLPGEHAQCLPDHLPDPVAQLLRGRHRVGHDEDIRGRQALLHDQAQEQARDGVGLPRAGACLDEVPPVERACQQIEAGCGLGHLSAPPRHARAGAPGWPRQAPGTCRPALPSHRRNRSGNTGPAPRRTRAPAPRSGPHPSGPHRRSFP